MKNLYGLILAVPLLLGVFNYSSNANVSGKGIYYDNFDYTSNVAFRGAKGTAVDYSAEFRYLGDSYDLTFDIINDSGVDVQLSELDYNKSDPYIVYDLKYADGKRIKIGDILKKGEKIRVNYHVLYKNQVQEDTYNTDDSFSIIYDQVLY